MKDFFSVGILNGQLEFTYELGSGIIRHQSEAFVSDGLTHYIEIERQG